MIVTVTKGEGVQNAKNIQTSFKYGPFCGVARGRVAHLAAANGLRRDEKADGRRDAVGGAAVADGARGEAPFPDDAAGRVVHRGYWREARVSLDPLLGGKSIKKK